MPPLAPKSRWIDRALGSGVRGYIDVVEGTSRAPPLMQDYAVALTAEHPLIIAMWHGQFMLLPTLSRLGVPTKAMLALHRDAEGLAVALQSYGIELIRGAGAGAKGKDRGGANAFRAAAEALAAGFSVAMTADVPPGPARRAGHGIVTLAKISGRPILPVAMCTSRYAALPTWSRMTINLPFSQIGASFGGLVRVPADASADDLETLRREVETQLNIATVDAYHRAGVSHHRATPPRALAAAGEQLPPGLKLSAYVGGTRLFGRFAPRFLDAREKRGKEDGRRRAERFGEAAMPRPDGELIWLHAASVGETVTVLPLIEALQTARPAATVLLTTGTLTSARLAGARLTGRAIHQFVPLDVPKFVDRFLDHWQPDLAVFTESEIWPNLILKASVRAIPLTLVNARMSKASFQRWRANGSIARPLFSRFAVVLTQTREFADRFGGLGAPNVVVSGNLKFDTPPPPVDQALFEALKTELADRPVLVAASTHFDEESIVAEAHRLLCASRPDAVTVIVPRHPERGAEIVAKLRSRGFAPVQRSVSRTLGLAAPDASGLVVADGLGELGTWFALARVAFIGKSLANEVGGHNPIEAIRHGAAVLTGPHWTNFDQVYHALYAAKGAIEVRDAAAIATETARLIADPDAIDSLLRRASRVCDDLSGALPKSLAALLPLLPLKPADHRSARPI